MKDSKIKHKFRAQAYKAEFSEIVRGWKIQLWLFLLCIFLSFSQLKILPEGKIFSQEVIPFLVGAALLYFVISTLLNSFAFRIKERNREIEMLKRQLTQFICEASLGWVDKEDLKRLRNAVDFWAYDRKDDLKTDDFSLMSRRRIFWGKNGFECQDEEECANCGHTRKEHSQEGDCPIE